MESLGRKPETPEPADTPEAPESPAALEIIGLKEVLGMLMEIHASDEEVLDILQTIQDQPTPENDPDAEAEHLERLQFANEVAAGLSPKTERTTEIIGRIKQRINELQRSS